MIIKNSSYLKKLNILVFLLIFTSIVTSHADYYSSLNRQIFSNRALKLDGNDNDIRIGMDTINDHWTVEMWIKRDGGWTYPNEILIGAGQYGNLNDYDHLPLMLRSGKLHNNGANISSPETLDNAWHHVAASCDGSTTKLYIDGEVVASSNKATSIVPGNIGSNTEQSKTFKGLIDEVRIWRKAISQSEMKNWMNRPITREHPSYNLLKGYYPFDDGMEEMSPNLMGVAPYPFHAILTKVGAKSGSLQKPATYVINDNNSFNTSIDNQEIISVISNSTEWDFDKGAKNVPAHSLAISVTGSSNPINLEEIILDMSNVSNPPDIEKVHLYYLGNTPKSDNPTELLGFGMAPSSNELVFSSNSIKIMNEGTNYFLLTYDISDKAIIGNKVDAKIKSITLEGENIAPLQNDTLAVVPEITNNSSNNINTLKVMSWNIWHGGKHLGDLTHGQESVIDIIKRSNADIILMQEAYGTQEMIKDSLGFYMHTFGSNDNLALFSRYPITKLSSNVSAFNSIGVTLELPNKKKIAVFDVWLKYAYRPEYTTWYYNHGYDTQVWIDEDKILNLKDINEIFASDVSQVSQDLPIILGGDFNSCSHLDWTEKAKVIHNGYGPVAFPTSQRMLDEGFIDSYRTVHPDELIFPGGTWAASFGQVDSRIDFIYSKGEDITPVASKIIRTSNTINYPWPGDHSAVLTTYKTGDDPVPTKNLKITQKISPKVLNVSRTDISLIIPQKNNYKITITDLLGKTLYSKSLYLKSGKVHIPVYLKSGIKIVSIRSKNTGSVRKVIIK